MSRTERLCAAISAWSVFAVRANGDKDARMQWWLAKAGRRRAGQVLALIYAFCVFASNLAVASPHCLLTEGNDQVSVHGHVVGVSHSSDASGSVKIAMKVASSDHMVPNVRSNHPATTKSPQGTTCCVATSVPGLPAESIEILPPRTHLSEYLPRPNRSLADRTSVQHYRPPIS